MSYHYFFLTVFALLFSLTAQEPAQNRSLMGENWKIISRGSIGTGVIGYTITASGNYTLSESITPLSGNTNTIIQIDSDDVVLDLAGHTLNGTNVSGKGIFVNNKKNITIQNGHLDGVQNNNIHISSGCRNVRVIKMTFTNPGSAIDIQIDASNTLLHDITVSGGGSSGSSINCANTINDLIFDGIRISNIIGKGINLGTNSYNIRLKHIDIDTCTGSNNAIALGTGCYDIILDHFRCSNISSDGISIGNACYGIIFNQGTITNCSGSGILFGTDTHGIHLSHINITGCASGITSSGTNGSVIQNCTIAKNYGADSYACKLTASQNIIIEKSRFFESVGTGNTIGIWLVTCTNVQCTDVQSGGHIGTQGIGFKLDTNCFGCHFENCVTRGDFATSTTAFQGAIGFHLTATKGCTFTNCISTSHQGTVFSCGYYLNGSSGNSFINCKSLQNFINGGSPNALAAGFCSIGGSSNIWNECESNAQHAGTVTSNAGYGAAGFYISNETQSAFFRCKALGNGSCTNHPATAAGFYFDAILNPACKFVEVRECNANSNCTSATSGITAYGFYDAAAATSNVFIDCYAASNSDNASIRNVTNYSANLPIGGSISSNFPRVEANIDGLLDIANKPLFYNVSITS